MAKFWVVQCCQLLIRSLAKDKMWTKAAKLQLATHVDPKSEIRNQQHFNTPLVVKVLWGYSKARLGS